MNLRDLSFTKDWALFLDRDGVINKRIEGGYVTRWQDFEFLDGALEALAILKGIFGFIFIVSNQQGVGKGIMLPSELEFIDLKMKDEIRNAGGRIDASYYCPHLESENHPDRKPQTGMGLKARRDFPVLDLAKSVMAGDSITDMQFGRNLGMINVLISNNPVLVTHNELFDFNFDSIRTFTQQLTLNI